MLPWSVGGFSRREEKWKSCEVTGGVFLVRENESVLKLGGLLGFSASNRAKSQLGLPCLVGP